MPPTLPDRGVTRRGLLAGATTALLPLAARAAPPGMLAFELHAAFFSRETHQNPPIDPQAFAFDATAKAAIGPQGIHHVAGYRPALLDGPRDIGAFNALGTPLGFTIGNWFAATGQARILPAGKGARVICRFQKLRPNGVYSLFENHFDQKPIGFTPLDGHGTHNNFVAGADGTAAITVQTPAPLGHANALLLVYHSDNKTHGMMRGALGVTAHHQLIARIPA